MKFIALAVFSYVLINQVFGKPAEGCLQTHTIVPTDSCVSVASQYHLTDAEFFAMNPGLHHSIKHDCDNLDTGKPYCVCMTEPCPVAAEPVSSSAVSSSIAPVSTSSGLNSSMPSTPAAISASNVSSASVVSGVGLSSSPSASLSVRSALPALASSSASYIESSSFIVAGISFVAGIIFI
ncbi:hypothetical protein G6F57_005362 [Rhizopus arrhizus]|uniref:LysM domain-containing protein n=2 Tax=Rhizopus oryzae TaxID=64495 RepID=A0A9P6X578_RHIOR|nr:hypothetical protein G6F23_005318 [Rhizopus arrhizus]KAG1418754.1 hypothetical protein G6F58_004926 [Rhizopus delemar]KAG0760424.1 hypothetical protein G6F24_008330 [Rhizopus arrhizus]KAG0779589.1 hypothetical protein G6F22_010551 [Rhizopus arrhizus]KAG0786711.1 hypothetical protein G6F21_008403 [Rhizopus arrhizus]